MIDKRSHTGGNIFCENIAGINVHKFYGYCLWGAKLKQCDVLTIVHDVRSLKGKYGFSEKEIAILNQSDKLIVHNHKMRAWFEQQNIQSQLANIEAFDYLHTDHPQAARTPIDFEQIRVVFAGNMGPFIYELDHLILNLISMALASM